MQVQGAGILFAIGDVNVTLTGLGALTLLQSSEVTHEADEELIKDSTGSTRSIAKYDLRSKAVLEFVPTAGTQTGTVAVTAWPTIGSTIAFTDSTFTPIAGNWIVDGLNFSRSNTRALMCRINLSKYTDNTIP